MGHFLNFSELVSNEASFESCLNFHFFFDLFSQVNTLMYLPTLPTSLQTDPLTSTYNASSAKRGGNNSEQPSYEVSYLLYSI